jgi:hypothetical protein
MRKIFLFIGVIGAIALTSCSTTYPGLATSNPIGSKTGVAERKIFLGLAFGHTDLGVSTAAKNGKITKIATVDVGVTGGLFSTTYKVIVTGE